MIRLDTHVAVWLYAGDVGRLSETALEAIDRDDLVISPAVELELTYLHEIGRLTVSGAQIVADLRDRVGLTISEQSFASVVAAASPLAWTRDPFDRLIAGDALAANQRLLTKDVVMHEHLALAAW